MNDNSMRPMSSSNSDDHHHHHHNHNSNKRSPNNNNRHYLVHSHSSRHVHLTEGITPRELAVSIIQAQYHIYHTDLSGYLAGGAMVQDALTTYALGGKYLAGTKERMVFVVCVYMFPSLSALDLFFVTSARV